MERKGIHYDTGVPTTHGTSSRETFDARVVRREIGIIRNDLHCNAIRISGQQLERLVLAAQFAQEAGLEVWFSPSLPDATEAETLTFLEECARAAEELWKRDQRTVLVLGVELSAFMRGLLEGETAMERLGTLMNPWRLIKSTLRRGSFHKKLNTFLQRAITVARTHFHGQISYASGPWEEVDWSPFDIVGVDYYRDSFNKSSYEKNLNGYFVHSKPVVITEFGTCTYRGAQDKGGYGWAVVDWKKTPPQLKREFVRDETEQARVLIELLEIFEAQAVAGAFVFTFVSPAYPFDENPVYDLDLASYSVVKTYRDRNGSVYQDLPWEPKEAFVRLADYYARHPSPGLPTETA